MISNGSPEVSSTTTAAALSSAYVVVPSHSAVGSIGSASGGSSIGSSDERFVDPVLPRKGSGAMAAAAMMNYSISGGHSSHAAAAAASSSSSSPSCSSSPHASSRNRSVYSQVWKGLIFLATDPCPEVANLAQQIIYNVHDKVRVSGNNFSWISGAVCYVFCTRLLLSN